MPPLTLHNGSSAPVYCLALRDDGELLLDGEIVVQIAVYGPLPAYMSVCTERATAILPCTAVAPFVQQQKGMSYEL